MMRTRVLVIGAGPAGMMAAGTAGENGCDVLLLERNQKNGRKLMITGKGRCNVSNNCKTVQELIDNVPGNGRFLFGAFSKFMPSDLVDFIESRGVPLKVERGNRIFPVSDKAADIVDCFVSYAQKHSRRIEGRAMELIIESGEVRGARLESGEVLSADKVIIATGGLSYPATGSTGDGYALAKQAGHTVIDTAPSLVPLEIHEGFCSDLMGLSLRNTAIKLIDTKRSDKVIYKDFGEML
ncbi:MAG: aminoacetone oxidase family FAD-binding enzyme, partial [Clostridia bacterium]|nr:aminoacetone oxidase family FAD-binding enzyme [Clostridia bacterium]